MRFCVHSVFHKKLDPLIFLCVDRYELHENFQKYIGGVACCEYEINVCDSLAILC